MVSVLIFLDLLSNPRTGLGLPLPECLLGLFLLRLGPDQPVIQVLVKSESSGEGH